MGKSDHSDGAGDGLSAEFMSRLVHQLRTPLNVVLGYGDLVQHGERAGWSADERANFDAMQRGAQKILHILDDVGTWTALQGGMTPDPSEPVDLQAALAGLGTDGIDRQGRLRIAPDSAGPGPVAAPPALLQRMLRSLAVHALAADSADGPVTVSTARLPSGLVRVEFLHRGAAISAETAAGLFRPFARVRAGEHGTGLGLAIAATLSERLGGSTSYAAAPDGKGGAFRLDLPAAEAPAAAATPARPPPAPSAVPLRVLYIEDVAANRELVGRILRAMTNMAVDFAESAEEGLARVQSAPPDLILMDINLPGMDGFEALQRLKADPKTRHIPVIALTAATHADDLAQGQRAPFAAYLTKPIDAIALVDALNAAQPGRQGPSLSPER